MFGGGVALLVRCDLPAVEVILHDEYKNIELICVDLVMNSIKYRVIIVIIGDLISCRMILIILSCLYYVYLN